MPAAKKRIPQRCSTMPFVHSVHPSFEKIVSRCLPIERIERGTAKLACFTTLEFLRFVTISRAGIKAEEQNLSSFDMYAGMHSRRKGLGLQAGPARERVVKK